MREQGFAWPSPGKLRSLKFSPMNGRRYGVIELTVAAKWGYHAPGYSDGEDHQESGPKSTKPTAEAVEAYTGRASGEVVKPGTQVKTDACRPRGEREIYGVAEFKPQWASLMQYHHRSFVDASKDPRVTRVMADWRSCMARFGYKYRDVWEANNDPRWQTQDISSTERSTAERDVRCKKESRYPSVILSVESELQESHVKRHAGDFTEIEKYFKRTAEKASLVVEADSTS
ncbi:hypothetical protein ACFVU3_36655 [Streptomyces sp. NPDC058052]|uniref:hypothetical protein n=1 Tax=Streptomyces sp. NPDC058052 TaxID=3346316 RepID=UPI0036E7B67C